MERQVSGFTLMELMVTIAVASVVLVIAVPSFNQLIISNRLVAQTNEMIAAVNFARSAAIKRNGSVAFCRAASATVTDCASANGAWEHWIVRTNTGNVVRRGTVNTYAGTIVVRSTLTDDQAVFGSDGLVRTGAALVNDHRIDVCATNAATDNIRRVVLGAGSRISTEPLAGDC